MARTGWQRKFSCYRRPMMGRSAGGRTENGSAVPQDAIFCGIEDARLRRRHIGPSVTLNPPVGEGKLGMRFRTHKFIYPLPER